MFHLTRTYTSTQNDVMQLTSSGVLARLIATTLLRAAAPAAVPGLLIRNLNKVSIIKSQYYVACTDIMMVLIT